MLAKHVPPGVLITEDGEILHIRGRSSRYLEPAAGQATLNIFKMAREGLRIEIRTALSAGDDDRAEQVERYERAHKNRAGVLSAAEREHSNA